MKLSSTLTGAAVLALVSAMPAYATTFTGTQTPTVHSSGSGLVIETQSINSNLNFTLNAVGQSVSSNLFNIYTNETQVDPDDLSAKPISVAFNFTSPAFGGVLSGTTFGESFFGVFQNGALTWNNSGTGIFNFGNGGKLQVNLNDTEFNSGLYGLDQGVRDGGTVTAKFTLLAMTSAAPEPATWAFMIFGFGAAGYSLRRRRVSYGSAVAA
jgi:hypothetical protein